jgi:CDP-diglyceride synthetase
MKKDLIFAPLLIVIGVLLFLLRLTGIYAHIAISAVGVVALIAYTVLTKKEWRLPILEIGMRVAYGVALITGIVIWNVYGLTVLAVIHKVLGGLFIVGVAALLAHKLTTSKKA